METNSNSAGIPAPLLLPVLRFAGLVLAVLAGSVLGPQTALASFAGANGRIVFNSSRDGSACFPYCGEIYAMAPDGGGQTRLINNPANDVDPAWSPSGQKIAFTSYRGGVSDVYVMNADGTGQTKVAYGMYPAWSPDGTKLVVASGKQGNFDIYVMNADGSGSTQLTSDLLSDILPAWSPNGQKIAFVSNRGGVNYDLYTMNTDGTAQTKVTSTGATEPSWSPDGSRIAFRSLLGGQNIYTMNPDGSAKAQLTRAGASFDPVWSPDGRKIAYVYNSSGHYEIYTMNADGSGNTDVSNNLAHDFDPDWQPVQYLTPQSGSPLAVSLVPTFKQCGTGGNPVTRSHSLPLSVSSCLPAPRSAVALVGSQNQGSGRFSVIPGDGNPSNGDQADVSITASITDVQTTLGGDFNPNAGADMTLIQRLRITDLSNGSSQRDPATATEFDFRAPLSCSTTPDPAVGSTCSANTTADSITPGMIRESKRAVIQIFRVRVEDAGQDSVLGTADDMVFAHEGIFVP